MLLEQLVVSGQGGEKMGVVPVAQERVHEVRTQTGRQLESFDSLLALVGGERVGESFYSLRYKAS